MRTGISLTDFYDQQMGVPQGKAFVTTSHGGSLFRRVASISVTLLIGKIYSIASCIRNGVHKEGRIGVLRHFQQLRSYHNERNHEEIPFSSSINPRGLSVAGVPWTVLHNSARLCRDQGPVARKYLNFKSKSK